jgi:NifU-like protein
MSYEELIQKSLWGRFSEKMAKRITSPHNCGYFTVEEGEARGMRCIEGRGGFILEASAVTLYWLVDPTDGMIVDAKFQVFGQAALIAAAEGACELLVGKNYDQVRRIGGELIDKSMRDHPDTPAFPEETFPLLNLILEAIDDAVEKCLGIPLSKTYVSPLPEIEEGSGYPGWLTLSHQQKLALIEKVLDEDVRPYVELDEGGIEVQALIDDKELVVAYSGSCTSCFSAIGATLSTIQQIIQSKVHPDLKVVPNMDALHL